MGWSVPRVGWTVLPEGMDSSFQKPFRFEHMWLTDKGCSDMVEAVWNEPITDPWETRVLTKIDKCGQELARWSRKSFGNVKHELEKKKKKQLQQAERGSQNWKFQPHENPRI